MLLVNVGNHTINVEQVVAFFQDQDYVKVMFNARTGDIDGSDPSLYTIELAGEEAERMRAWLKRNAEGVRGTAQTGFSIEE